MANSYSISNARALATEGACETASDCARPCRRLDPRASFLILLLLNATAFAPTTLWIEGAAIVFTAALMCWCGRASAALRWTAAYAALMALTWLFVAFPNPVTSSFGTMVVMFRRVFVVGMFASNMIATTRVGEVASALQRAHVPRGAVVAVAVGLRFFPTMGAEFKSVAEAMRVRGIALSPASVLRHPAKVMENLLVPVMSRLSIVADELANAAVVRGIDSDAVRTSYYELRLGAPEAVFLLAYVATAGAVALVRAGVIA